MTNYLIKCISRTDAQSQTIINMRFGIGYNKSYCFEEIAKFLNIDREEVLDIEKETMRKLRNQPFA